MKQFSLRHIVIFAVIFLIFIPMATFGDGGYSSSNNVTFDWHGPSDGDILRYRIQFSTDYGVTWPYEYASTDTFYTFISPNDGPVNIRIKAVDLALNESDSWSPTSDTVIVDTHVPGGCGAGVWRR